MHMREQQFVVSVGIALMASATAPAAQEVVSAAQEPVAIISDDDITIRGCVRPVDVRASAPTTVLVWTRGDIMLVGVAAAGTNAPNPIGTSGIAGRVFYWLEHEDDLSNHVGQLVEIRGELKDVETGEVEIERDGDFIEIELDLDGMEGKARVPASWLGGAGADRDREFEIVTRRVDVDDVRVLAACNVS
jgi:hypothetical protein